MHWVKEEKIGGSSKGMLLDVMSWNDALQSVLFHCDLDTAPSIRENACACLIPPPSMPKPFLLSAHLLLSTFLLSAYFLAVHSYKCMRSTTSVYGYFVVWFAHAHLHCNWLQCTHVSTVTDCRLWLSELLPYHIIWYIIGSAIIPLVGNEMPWTYKVPLFNGWKSYDQKQVIHFLGDFYMIWMTNGLYVK